MAPPPPGSRGLLGLWLRAVSLLVPAGERERWREEWRADVDDTRGSGAGTAALASLALGLLGAALTFRFEGMTMDGWTKETLHAVRGLLRRPGFTLIAIVTLGLGIGANTAIFSVVNGVVLEPLPYPEPDELVMLTSSFPTMGFEGFWISPPEYMQISENLQSFASVGAYGTQQVSIGADEQPERVDAGAVSRQLFETLGVSPLMGRTFSDEEDQPNGPSVVVLSQELWERSFGADPQIVGRQVRVNGQSATVIGVMPRGFDVNEIGAEVWVPLGLDWANRQNYGSHYLYLVARLRPGATVPSAERELGELMARWDEVVGSGHISPDNHPLHMVELQEEVVGDVRPALLVLLGAVGFVLLIACANVANLLLARAQDRHKEVAVRAAMGAGHGRLLRQFLTEGLVLSVTGAALGTVLAFLSLDLLQAAGPGDLPRLSEVGIDGSVLAFTTALAVLTGVFFGLAPARHIATGNLAGSLGDGGARTTSSSGQRRLRSLLVISETALALILAVGAGLMIRSFAELNAVEPGFEPEGLLTFQVFLPAADYPDAEAQSAFQRSLIERLSAEPGVARVGAMTGLPPVRRLNANDTEFEGYVQTEDSPPQNVDFYQGITPGYLETMGIELVEGRGFEPTDDAQAVPVALVNRALAERFYPTESPIGRRVRPCCGGPFLEIVGVVENVKNAGLDQPAGTELYFSYPQALAQGGLPRTMIFVVETQGDPATFAPAVRRHVWALDSTLPVAGLQPMTEVMGDAMARARFLTALLAAFAGLALLLAAVGTYGVMSYAVTRRAREMGIRMAMGAEAGTVQRLVLGEGLRTAAVGLAAGLAGAWALSGMLESMLYDTIGARDPVSFLAGPVVLVLVAVAACWIPARRATRVDPVSVLREE